MVLVCVDPSKFVLPVGVDRHKHVKHTGLKSIKELDDMMDSYACFVSGAYFQPHGRTGPIDESVAKNSHYAAIQDVADTWIKFTKYQQSSTKDAKSAPTVDKKVLPVPDDFLNPAQEVKPTLAPTPLIPNTILSPLEDLMSGCQIICTGRVDT